MRKFTALAVLFVFFTAAFALYADCMGNMQGMDMKGMDMKGMKMGSCKMMDEANCPFCVKGAVVKVVNTKDGIQVLVTSANKDTAKAIQEKGAKFASTCTMAGGMEKTGSAAVVSSDAKETTMDGDPEEIVQCPVTKEKIKKKNAFKVYEYKGKKYYFCCSKCEMPFLSDPEKYTK
jgi:YHS domain-containing protein/predicted metal-binding protein